jgi:acyl dehydratase
MGESEAAGDAQEITPYTGLRYRTRTMVVDAAEEARLLGHCGIDPAVFRGAVDPAAFITLAIQEGVMNGVSSDGGVNMVEALVQHRPVGRDETLTVSGEIVDVASAPRGLVTTSATRYHGADGTLALAMQRTSLKTDPRQHADPALRGAGTRPPPVIADLAGLKTLGRFALTPEGVKAYNLGTTNRIHLEEDAARRAGFRAPIIGGGHGVRFLTAALWRAFAPRGIDVEIYFRRPLFWDDAFDIMVDAAGGRWRAMCLAKDGKVATEMRINAIIV